MQAQILYKSKFVHIPTGIDADVIVKVEMEIETKVIPRQEPH